MSEEAKKTADETGPETGPPPAEPSAAEEYLDKLSETPGELSLDEVDSFLEFQDPKFAEQLNTMKGDRELHAASDDVDIETAALHDEIEKWRSGSKLKRNIYFLMPFLPRLALFLKAVRLRLIARIRLWRMGMVAFLKYLATTGRKESMAWARARVGAVTGGIGQFFADFGKLSLKLKLAVLGIVLFMAGSGAVMYLAWKGKLLPGDPELFVTDLGAHASEVYEVEADEGFENFYENVRSTPNLLLINKIVINLKPSKDSGANPMAAAEFFVEGLNPDVVIEVKDREPFFRDLIQRTSEDFTFNELETPEGKLRYGQTILKEMNRNLTTGELRNVRIKTMILKP